MKKNIFVSTTFAPDNAKIERVLQACVQNGIRYVELGSNHRYEPKPGLVVQKYDCCYLVHNYFPIPEKPFVVNIASLDDEIYRQSLKHIFGAIDFCDRIGARLYTFHPGFLTDPTGAKHHRSDYDFTFEDQCLRSASYGKAFEKMLQALSEIVVYASGREVRIAIETQGSMMRPDHLLMQHPDEYQRFFAQFSPEEIGVNLNLGHLRLSANAFGFEIHDFVDVVARYVVAMELSHNNGIHDEHRPLIKGAWYWQVLSDPRFSKAYKILEFRNTPVTVVRDALSLCHAFLANHQ